MATVSDGRNFLRLHVAGANARSREALKRVFELCEEAQKGNHELEVIDVYQRPELERQNQIVATPTLVKILPLPMRGDIGYLSDTPGLPRGPAAAVRAPSAT
jgi:circadian clock protein KaiB